MMWEDEDTIMRNRIVQSESYCTDAKSQCERRCSNKNLATFQTWQDHRRKSRDVNTPRFFWKTMSKVQIFSQHFLYMQYEKWDDGQAEAANNYPAMCQEGSDFCNRQLLGQACWSYAIKILDSMCIYIYTYIFIHICKYIYIYIHLYTYILCRCI